MRVYAERYCNDCRKLITTRHAARCESCHNKWRLGKDGDEIRRKSRLYARNLRMLLMKKLGEKCVKCGFDDYRALQVDHIKGSGKKELKEKFKGSHYTMYRYYVFKDDREKYVQILCANCNWIKRHVEKEGNQH